MEWSAEKFREKNKKLGIFFFKKKKKIIHVNKYYINVNIYKS